MRLRKGASWCAHRLWGNRRRLLLSLAGAFVVTLLVASFFVYRYVTHGGMGARRTPAALEVAIAGRLVDWGIPAEAKAMTNPLGAANSADLLAGRALYRANCEICHGSDGSGKTAAGALLYPRAADLRGERSRRRSDGAIFYLIRNGIRNTGMPAWNFTDRQTWQIVSYVRKLPPTAGVASEAHAGVGGGGYVGSAACASCHREIYERWRTTLMANVVRDPREHPEAIIPDLSKPNQLVHFTKDDVAFVYGSKWKQRYFTKVEDDFFPLGAQWDVTHKVWKPYFVKEDWWVEFYPPDNMKRPTGSTCDGCHSVNYDVTMKRPSEWNVGCEKCHGPGGDHVRSPMASNIFCPSRVDYVQANDSCIQCHSQGRPKTNPVQGRYYDWPVGFEVGKKLADFWTLEEHKLGETTFTHFADGTAHKNRMQGNDFVQSLMYQRGVTCFSCHDAHGTDNNAMLRKPKEQLCLDCHSPGSANGPRAATLEAHTHHKAGSAGSSCVECHMPKIAQTLGDVNVRSHTFKFVSPEVSELLKVPNACNACHTDKSVEWTKQTLKEWSGQSPWRLGQ